MHLYINPSDINSGKLAKVLSYICSAHDGEALAALHAVRRMLGSAKMSSPDTFSTISPDTDVHNNAVELQRKSGRIKQLEEECARLQASLRESAKRNARLSDATTDLECQIGVLERALSIKCKESEGWRQRAWHNFWALLNNVDVPMPDRQVRRADNGE